MAILQFLGRYGRQVLIVGLIAGVLLPDLAQLMKPYLPLLVALLLFVAALRIGPYKVFGTLRELPGTIGIIGLYQVVMPLALLLLFKLAGFDGPLAFAIVLLASASAVSGAANLVLMTNNNAAPAMRLLIAGTALLPLTVLPVLWWVPEIGSAQSVFIASARLLILIVFSAMLAFAIRHYLFPDPSPETLQAFDGLSALTMAITVIGLMSAVGPALDGDFGLLAITFMAALAANFGLQLFTWVLFRAKKHAANRVSYSIVAGNRNMALFLAALPTAVTDPILLFIGCFQIPMYLTPILLAWLYKDSSAVDRNADSEQPRR